MIKSRYKPFQIFITLFISIFFGGITSILLVKDNFSDLTTPSFLIIFFVFFLPYILFQRAPRITLEDNIITAKYLFKTKKYDWNSITDIFLSKKEYYSILFILGQDMESTSILFENNEKLILWEDMYSNLAEMREFISEKANEKIKDPKPKVNNSAVLFFDRKIYSGNVWTSFKTIIVAGVILSFGYLILTSPPPKKKYAYLILLMPFIFYTGFGNEMNYFILEGENFIIKNQFFPWKKKVFKLNDISEFVIESPYKRSNSLRVITKEFRSKLFGAGSLRDKHWKEFKDDITTIGIPVRSEIDID